MPVVQLQDDSGANLGAALGAVGGYLATQKQRKADAQRKQSQEDTAAADTHARIQSEIAKNNAELTDRTQQGVIAQKALGAFNANLPLLDSATVGPDGKKLTGPALANALQNLRNKALNEGAFSDPATHDQNLREFNTEIARVMQQNAPKISDVEHGLPQPVTSGKKAWSPQQMAQHYLADATSRVLGSDMPEDQKKLYIQNFQDIAKPYLAEIPKPGDAERERHDRATEQHWSDEIAQGDRRMEALIARVNAGHPITPYEQQTLDLAKKRFEAEFPGGKKPTKPAADEKPRAISATDDTAIRQEVRKNPNMTAQQIADEWGLPLRQAQVFVPNAAAAPAPADPAPTATAPPAAGGGGQKRTVSLQAAMALPGNKGKTSTQVQADIVAHGYSVVP